MKVGVVLDEYVPQDGGAFTLQEEILDSILNLVGECQHQFVIIGEANQRIEEKIRSTKVDWMPLRQPGLIENIIAIAARNWPKLRRGLRWRSSFEHRARNVGIEFMWFLGQRPRDVDLPYMAIVFDLQHRLQPWFPEVSQFGEWDARESGFARHLRRASAIITGTKAGKDEIVRFYQIPEERVHILRHPTPGYALGATKTNLNVTLWQDLQPGYLFYPAQFWAHKNHVNLLLALKILSDEGLKIPLVFAGSDFGNQDFVKQRVHELGLADQVKFVGFVDRDRLIGFYQNALALAYLSFFGPENLPPLEAMALGCPVIAANANGVEEQLGESALLVNPSEPKEIAFAIRKLHGDRVLRDRLIASGRKRAESWTAIDFLRGAFEVLEGFVPIRRTWN